MSLGAALESSVKGEVQSSGAKLVAQDKVSLASGSETGVQAFVRVTPPAKVRLTTEVGLATIHAECGCNVAARGQVCKHIWAVMLAAEARYPDFFVDKNFVEVAAAPTATARPTSSVPETRSAAQADYAASAKARASAYRKEQYQKQKLAAKNKKRAAAGREPLATRVAYSDEIEAALAYFALNGFEMPQGPDADILSEAKRKLSRVFHPDKGGTTEEIQELNRYCDLLSQL